MNDNLTALYLQKVLGSDLFQKPRLLVWDSFKSHISVAVKGELKKKRLDVAVVPVGCTKYVQPADVSWNKPFKSHIRELYTKWLSTGQPFSQPINEGWKCEVCIVGPDLRVDY